MLSCEDFILILLADFGGSFESATKLQKMAFLSIYENQAPKFTEFEWHHYGPYSRELQEIVEFLDESGWIVEEEESRSSNFGDSYTVKTLRLTSKGKEAYARKLTNIKPYELKAVRDTIRKYGDKPLSSILNYVYQAYSPSDL